MTNDSEHEGLTVSAIHERLQIERKAAEGHMVALTSELAELVGESEGGSHDDEHDPEGSTIAYERARVTGLHQRATDRLQSIDRALNRLDDGSYRTCTRCHRPIDTNRLVARPETSLCIECARNAGSTDVRFL
jgi:DnaK suppressor protein